MLDGTSVECAFLIRVLKNAVIHGDYDSVDQILTNVTFRSDYLIQPLYESLRQNRKGIFNRFMSLSNLKGYVSGSRYHYVCFNIAYEAKHWGLASRVYDVLCKDDRADADQFNPQFLSNEAEMFQKLRYHNTVDAEPSDPELCVACNGEAFRYEWDPATKMPVNTSECKRCKGIGYEPKR
jgi:hypothetical protein